MADYADLTQQLIKKGDFRIAKKLAHQAQIEFPDSVKETAELYAMAQRADNELRCSSFNLQARLFDFLIVPSFRTASIFLELALNLHPELGSALTREVDAAILNFATGSLIQRYRHILANPEAKNHRFGLVMHRFLLEKQHIEISSKMLSRTCSAKSFLQVVRDPVSAFLSELNHELIVHYLGEYRFQRAGLSWPAQQIVQVPRREIPESEIDRLFEFMLPWRIYYSLVSREFRKYFPEWKVLPFDELLPDRLNIGLEKLFSHAGGSPEFRHEFLAHTAFGHLGRVMENNWTKITTAAGPLNVRVGFAFETTMSPSSDAIELCRTDSGDEEFRRPLALCVRVDDWVAIHTDTRKKTIIDGEIKNHFEKILLPAWLSNWKQWKNLVKPALLKDLGEERRRKLLDFARDELRAFRDEQPAIVKTWECSPEI